MFALKRTEANEIDSRLCGFFFFSFALKIVEKSLKIALKKN